MTEPSRVLPPFSVGIAPRSRTLMQPSQTIVRASSASTTIPGWYRAAYHPAMPPQAEPMPDVAYYDDGAIRYRGFQLDGQMHGEWEFFRRDGSVMRAGRFERGAQVGVWRTFDRAGNVVRETDVSKRPG